MLWALQNEQGIVRGHRSPLVGRKDRQGHPKPGLSMTRDRDAGSVGQMSTTGGSVVQMDEATKVGIRGRWSRKEVLSHILKNPKHQLI